MVLLNRIWVTPFSDPNLVQSKQVRSFLSDDIGVEIVYMNMSLPNLVCLKRELLFKCECMLWLPYNYKINNSLPALHLMGIIYLCLLNWKDYTCVHLLGVKYILSSAE